MELQTITEERLSRHVATRKADLLCDICGHTRHRPHRYDHLRVLRDNNEQITGSKIMFRCDEYGTVRQWGELGPRPEGLVADDDDSDSTE